MNPDLNIQPDATTTLERAAEIIAEQGHCKGALSVSQMGDDDLMLELGVCLVGAVSKAATGSAYAFPRTFEAFERIAATIGRDHLMSRDGLGGEQVSGALPAVLAEWNDRDSTTVEDVLLVLKKAAHDG